MSKIKSLREVFEENIKDLYSAESQLLKALPKMAKAASSESLREALEAHLEETQQQLERLEQIGEELEFKLTGKTCKAMKGLIEEGKEALEEEVENDAFLDVLIIGAAQRVEHYEISAYGTARTIAEKLGLSNAVELLQETLDEEEGADEKLSSISEGEVLNEAMSGEEEEEDEDEKPMMASMKSKKSSSSKESRR